MSLDKSQLVEFLEVLGEELFREITLVAVGGTALTLLDLKSSTMDVDFTIPHEDYEEFTKAEKATPHGFEIDKWKGGMVFSTMLPEDYLTNSIPLKLNLENIKLYALHPLDIVITKIGRLNDRDIQDIETCIKKHNITKEQIKQRASQIGLAGSEKAYDVNLQIVLNTDFN
ncbi:DUF6036 family nucleotidyltransferase [Nitrosopumilus sp. Nsub]|uniref:DUF6036 family nucleotidyltransferase n=1 Tax=Nitrosopumilus sp. Nsub TaxID=1776294 RepID=UPI000835C2A3|nr:DUF6036 family nucleotidyltransferase [Nitrosopumilus sp. Nsub]